MLCCAVLHCTTRCAVSPAGIIDMLQAWTWTKRVERALKMYVRLKDGFGLSAMPPYPYAQRFILMMRSHLDVSLCALRSVPGVT